MRNTASTPTTPAVQRAAYSPRLNPAHPPGSIPRSASTAAAERSTSVIRICALSVAARSSAVPFDRHVFHVESRGIGGQLEQVADLLARFPEIHAHPRILGSLAGKEQACYSCRVENSMNEG